MVRIARMDMLDQAYQIASTYAGNLTLRQLYYQLVAGGHIANDQREYKRLVDVMTAARLDGSFPLTWLIDRTRTVHEGSASRFDVNVTRALNEAAQGINSMPYWYLDIARWWGQPTQVSVWVEKEALAGVFEGPCEELGVSWFACKGYPSISALYAWVMQAHETAMEAQDNDDWHEPIEEFRILYFGDHDPDGWAIPRTAVERARQIVETEGLDLPPVRLERVALNMPQIAAFNPPPFPAKVSSSRYSGYVTEHNTTDAWELDALRPNQLDQLIRDTVLDCFDPETHEQNQIFLSDRRNRMRERMVSTDWFENLFRP